MFIWTANCITKKTTLVRTVPWMDALTVTVQVCHVDCGKGNELNWRDTFADGEDVGCNDGNDDHNGWQRWKTKWLMWSSTAGAMINHVMR